MKHEDTVIGTVITSSPSVVTIQAESLETFEKYKGKLQVGKLVKIADGNHNYAIAIITNISSSQTKKDNSENEWEFSIFTNPIGALMQDEEKIKFIRGTQVLPVPTEKAYVATDRDLEGIYSKSGGYNYYIGDLVGADAVRFCIDGNKFYSKHIGVVGSTGSGKSCAVTSLLHGVLGINNGKNINASDQKNSHIVIFDIHSEYAPAFTLNKDELFSLNILNSEKLCLPYWLMNSSELESIFIESGESNSHNQVSQFKRAVTLNKEKFAGDGSRITYDSPAYFSLKEVYNYIQNKNSLTTYEENGKVYLAILDRKIEYNENQLWVPINFESSTGNSKHKSFDAKVSKDGGFHGEFDRFVSRLETKINDKRLDFLLSPVLDGRTPTTSDFEEILKQLIGYVDKSNVTIIDLSGIPFEVLSITVSLVSRLLFDFAFHYSKIQHAKGLLNEIPFILVCEEAHNYIPRAQSIEYRASRQSIERIAKEGRKYGLGLMVVSQRPSEVSETIYSQCSNFIALRLTNINDQNYIKSLLPDGSSGLTDLLPSLGQGQAIVVGDSVIMPSIVQLPKPNPSPQSASVDVYDEWGKKWKDNIFQSIIDRWTKTEARVSSK